MVQSSIDFYSVVSEVPLFQGLSAHVLKQIVNRMQPLRYRMGQTILTREKLPHQVVLLLEGQIRLLGHDDRQPTPMTLQRLAPGAVLGWVGLIRGTACETAIASIESICLSLPASDFLALVAEEPSLRSYCQQNTTLSEVADVLSHVLSQQAKVTEDFVKLAQKAYAGALIEYVQQGKPLDQINPAYEWFVSQDGGALAPLGTRLTLNPTAIAALTPDPTAAIRLLGLFPAIAPSAPPALPPADPDGDLEDFWDTDVDDLGARGARGSGGAGASGNGAAHRAARGDRGSNSTVEIADIPYADPNLPHSPKSRTNGKSPDRNGKGDAYPHVRGKGNLDSPLACFEMISKHWHMPFRRDVLRRVLVDQLARTGSLSLMVCGAIAEMMGLHAQLVNVPVAAIGRLEAPALIPWQGNFAVLYEATDHELVLGVPELGIVRRKPSTVAAAAVLDQAESDVVPVLLLRQTQHTPQQKFGLQWFLPSVQKYRWVLLEVLIASFFVQLFGLANPLMIQVIIDKVIVQNSVDTLQVLGIFLIVVAIFEAILTSLRTFLFVDTTNRIDMALGSEIIDHLLRLPLRYFERRSVGELSTRINELENIRQFLTGTALTVVLDVFFSLFYIAIMFFYSWVLTAVALATIPLFLGLTAIVSPIIRQQLRIKAERNAHTQSYLVEVLSGIQTVKAQNIELKSRWQWQSRYARYVSAGFNTVITSTTAGAASHFFNQVSTLLVLWVGAYLVLKQELSLGQLIAFRIIAGYVTSPMLRLAQLWQNFQETALSIERLSDILDTPQETDELDRLNIPMPNVQGKVVYENVCFRFAESGAMQLTNINLEFPAGTFVAIAGQSGSGKSTLTKLLPRLYEPNSGRILIDDYDIAKVELYSLRRQIGIVPQDALLFEGTVQENIALTRPEASSDEIIAAAKVAFAHEFIMSLPNGYNTRVGERGASLSGGQRQRIAIARTVLQNPQMLILDEATSALDYDSERQVCLNLAEAFRDRTVFFITHRLNTIKNADLIVFLDKGSVVEQGTHEELLAIKGRYYCLYNQQEASIA